jgi:hypothetical protein
MLKEVKREDNEKVMLSALFFMSLLVCILLQFVSIHPDARRFFDRVALISFIVLLLSGLCLLLQNKKTKDTD